MANHAVVHHISRCIIKPEFVSEKSNQHFHLTPWDLSIISAQCIQKGLLFPKPPPANDNDPSSPIIDHLKDSLSRTLVHFLPLAGQLVTHKHDDPPSYSISISLDCENTPGVDFIHAIADVTTSDIVSTVYVPPVVQSFFPLNEAVNHDGHTLPLLAVQVTEILDGIFIACCFNHVVGDGTSYWHFFNAWAETCRMLKGKHDHISHTCQPLRFFHFSPQSIARLKAKANAECNTSTISSFQALSALVWRSITRVRRHLTNHQKTSCRLAINNRSRLNPPLSPDYFGNCVQTVSATATSGELLSHGIGWAALLLHEAVNGHTDGKVRGWLEAWMMNPFIYQLGNFFDPCSVMMASSPRFDMYGCDFGWGKAEAVRSRSANKFDGKVSSYQGRKGGSVDLEVSLPPESMKALEADPEFMDAVSPSHYLRMN
ncbi:hypothetical protein NE237_017535 [Protea cynaroides]|uniref:Acetyltransferase n=1 Tax=Protea cynaroides TaxID=273540 RepID=A0A9Q0K8B2_9MAGN|nr:hypothetical protein NE237_017535 [Protea cynaroides]